MRVLQREEELKRNIHFKLIYKYIAHIHSHTLIHIRILSLRFFFFFTQSCQFSGTNKIVNDVGSDRCKWLSGCVLPIKSMFFLLFWIKRFAHFREVSVCVCCASYVVFIDRFKHWLIGIACKCLFSHWNL